MFGYVCVTSDDCYEILVCDVIEFVNVYSTKRCLSVDDQYPELSQ